MITTVLFDLDGTLIDTEALHIASAAHALQTCGITLSDDEKQYIVARSPMHYFPIFCERYGKGNPRALAETLTQYYMQNYEEHTMLLTGVEETLEALYTRGIRMALVTSSPRRIVDIFLNRFSFHKYFTVIVAGDDVKQRKPYPEPYEKALALLGELKEHVLVVEDSSVGVESAHGAGLRVYAIPNEHTKDHDLSKATQVLTSLSGVLAALH